MASFSIKHILQLERSSSPERVEHRGGESVLPCCWKSPVSRSPVEEPRALIPCPAACYSCPCCERPPYRPVTLPHSHHYRKFSFRFLLLVHADSLFHSVNFHMNLLIKCPILCYLTHCSQNLRQIFIPIETKSRMSTIRFIFT